MCAAPAVKIVELYPTRKARGVRAAAAKPTTSASGTPTVYVYRWDRGGRKGQKCRCLARGTMNSCLLEFEDGGRMVTSRNALKKST